MNQTQRQGISLMDLQKKVAQFRDERGWEKYHNPKNLVISILVEAAELAEHFQWETVEEIEKRDREKNEEVAAELIDVLWYCLSLADRLNIDVTDAFLKKFAHNKKKFPKEMAGNERFYDEQHRRYRNQRKKYPK
jgi:NTP pyrophosphatase (non-canonical NTP hydrolase)